MGVYVPKERFHCIIIIIIIIKNLWNKKQDLGWFSSVR